MTSNYFQTVIDAYINNIQKEKERIEGIISKSPIDEFSLDDRKILGYFLSREKETKKHYSNRSEENIYLKPILTAKDHDFYQQAYFEKREEDINEIEKKINKINWKKAEQSDIVKENIAYLKNFPQIAKLALELEKAVIEAIPECIEMIKKETEQSDYEIAGEEDGRNEVYKKLFPSKEKFGLYHGILNRTHEHFALIKDIISNPSREDTECNKYFDEFMEFIKEDNKYNSKRADSIYG